MRFLFMSVATCAVCSMGAAVPAFAQDDGRGVRLGMTGYFKGYVVYNNQDDDATGALRGTDIIRDTELHFVGAATLDNGMVVGVDVGAGADQGEGFDLQDSFVHFSGDWGRVNFGATDGATYLLQVSAPAADANYDGMDQYYTPFHYAGTAMENLEFDYDQDLSSPADKLTYITPLFSGFQAAVSWTPETRSTSRSLDGADSATGLSDVVDLAAYFENDLSWGSYRIGMGYTVAEQRELFNTALDLDIGDFGVGVVYTYDNFDESAPVSGAVRQRQYLLGVDYTLGRYVLAGTYLDQENEFDSGDIQTDRYTGGVTYKYGPGVDFHGVVTHINHRVDTALGNDVEGTSLMLGTSIAF